jgi:hypothetical protein
MAGLLSSIVEAIHGSDEIIGGQAVTELTQPLDVTEVVDADVLATLGFGEFTDGASDARFVVGREIISATGRNDTQFTGLTRGLDNTKIKRHPPGSIVYDLAQNTTALDLVRRGMLVDFAIGPDLDVVARNLGLKKCINLTDDVWREVIRSVAYLAKQTRNAFDEAMTALVGPPPVNYCIFERQITRPHRVFVQVDVEPATSLKGRFVLNSGEQQLSTGLTTVETDYDITASPTVPDVGPIGVLGVYDDTLLTRKGHRDGFTNYFTGGSFVGNVITLGASPGAAGTALIIDYNGHAAHYLSDDDTIRDEGDFYPYFADSLESARCLLDQVRAAPIKVELSEKP